MGPYDSIVNVYLYQNEEEINKDTEINWKEQINVIDYGDHGTNYIISITSRMKQE